MSEVHELCITNLGPFFRKNQLARFLKENNVNFVTVDKPKNVPFGFVRFATRDERDAAFDELAKLELKGRKLAVRPVTPKRLKQAAWEVRESKRGGRDRRDKKNDGEEKVSATPKSIHDITTPWHNRPYEEQLFLKQCEISDALRRMGDRILGECARRLRESTASAQKLLGMKRERESEGEGGSELDREIQKLEERFTTPAWVEEARDQYNKRVCELLPIVPSPVTVGYRNKGQFTIGRDESGAPCVGFRLGGYSREGVLIASPEGSVHLPPAMLRVAQTVTEFVKSSPLPPYDLVKHVGIWRQLTVRVMSGGKEVMVELMTYPVTGEMEEDFARAQKDHYSAFAAYELEKQKREQEKEQEKEEEVNKEENNDENKDENKEQDKQGSGALPPPRFKYEEFKVPPTVALYKAELERFVEAMRALEGVTCVETYKEIVRTPTKAESISTASPSANAESEDTTATTETTTASEYKTTTLENKIATVSVFLQEYTGTSTPDTNHPRILLAGPDTIREEICGMHFHVSPGAFFQVNTPAADRLYRLARAMAAAGVDGAKTLMGLGNTGNAANAMDTSDATGVTNTTDAADGADTASAEKSTKGAVDALVSRTSFAPATFHEDKDPKVDKRMVLMDVCCGTGTIGIVSSPYAERVLGIDTAADGIEDARKNVLLNNLNLVDLVDVEGGGYRLVPVQNENAPDTNDNPSTVSSTSTSLTFVCDRAEAVLRDLLPYFLPAHTATATQDMVAIVDPPRGGLHPDLIRALRTSPSVQRVVYVSCNPTGTLVEDIMRFCVPQGNARISYARGPPFKPVLAVPLDLFPHTPHCELVMLLERAEL